MRAARRLFVLGLITFAVAFGIRRVFFWDVMPISWDQTAPRTGALEAAFLLLAIENVGAVVAVIALASLLWFWFTGRRRGQT
jgi:hypothetical protein